MTSSSTSMDPAFLGARPLAIDLFCGLGGWTEGLMSEGWDVIGFDVERHVYGEHRYPAQLVLQDVRTVHGSQFRHARLIVASSPCQEFSYRAMPWKRARELPPPHLGMELFAQAARIQREACEAAGRFIPMVQENVKGAQRWVGKARWHFGSFYLWGDVPALMPVAFREGTKNTGGSWFNVAHNTTSGHAQNPDGRKIHSRATHPKGGWFYDNNERNALRRNSSQSNARKAASAQIATIPFALASHIARAYYPDEYREGVA